MKTITLLAVAVGSLGGMLKADPLAEGTYVDLVVVPVGPVVLAEFEADTPPPAATTTETPKPGTPAPKKLDAPGGSGGGSGVRVKQQDPAEIAPASVFIKASSSKYYQVPCSLNAVGSPVRAPLTDSEVVLYQRIGAGASSFKELGKFTVTQTGGRVLVVLTKPLKEKRWDNPTLTAMSLPKKSRAQLFFVNGSQELQCGVKVATAVKALEPLKPLAWESTEAAKGVDVSLAMRDLKGTFMPPFYQSNVELKPNTTSVFIPYGVSAEESFRGGKFATGILENEVFRPASVYEIK